jgi:hypothetical protein
MITKMLMMVMVMIKYCKGGVQQYKAAWVFNKLVNAKTPEAIQ